MVPSVREGGQASQQTRRPIGQASRFWYSGTLSEAPTPRERETGKVEAEERKAHRLCDRHRDALGETSVIEVKAFAGLKVARSAKTAVVPLQLQAP